MGKLWVWFQIRQPNTGPSVLEIDRNMGLLITGYDIYDKWEKKETHDMQNDNWVFLSFSKHCGENN